MEKDDAHSSKPEESTDAFIRRKMRTERDPVAETLARKELVQRLMARRVTPEPIVLRPSSVIQNKSKEQHRKEKKLLGREVKQSQPKAAPPAITEEVTLTHVAPHTHVRQTKGVKRKASPLPKQIRKGGTSKKPPPKRDPSWHHCQTKTYTTASLRGSELLVQLDRVKKLATAMGAIYKVADAVHEDMAADTCYALARCARFSKNMRRVIVTHKLNAREANLVWKFPDELHDHLAEKMQWGSIPFSRLLRVKWGMDEGRDLTELLRGAGFSWPEGLSKSLSIPRR
jgi:hypothetical protein